ncbi:hypothetical protein RRG08_011885 [Elysia crispata]|uniref:Uncharacterized protein n=1 Tax=Elysia crispata TaxID=231223 RepID=A0AAE0ZP04_9GAST|nr:hypothetical protein RRG08_011885 [Elysia crispata]
MRSRSCPIHGQRSVAKPGTGGAAKNTCRLLALLFSDARSAAPLDSLTTGHHKLPSPRETESEGADLQLQH